MYSDPVSPPSCKIMLSGSGVAHDQICFRDRWRGFLPGERHRRRVSRRDPRVAPHQSLHGQARSLHQRRPRHDVAFPAWRGVRHRGRRGDRPRPRPLRALRLLEDEEGQQLHHRPDLRARHQQGAPRRLPRQHGAGDPAHHRRDQGCRSRPPARTPRSASSRSAARWATSSRCRSWRPSGRWASRKAAEHLLHAPHAGARTSAASARSRPSPPSTR